VRIFLVGLLAGFVGSMPVAGPTAALVLARALQRRTREAWLIALTAALPEGAYAFMACWGMSAVVERFPALVGASRLLAGVALALVGFWLLRRASSVARVGPGDSQSKRGVAVGLASTAANPGLLVSWSAAVGALHSFGLMPIDERSALPFSVGVTTGVAAWLSVMIRIVATLREHVQSGVLPRLVRGVGALLVAAGLVAAARAVTMRP
jgi:threonine/homoserine/homoserine lactone efflux protein